MKLSIQGTRDYFVPHQIANGVPVGTVISTHAFRETVFKYGRDPGRVALFFVDSSNAFNEADRQKILDAVVIHAPGIACCVNFVYGCAPWLIAGKHLIRSLQETLQDEPLGMYVPVIARYSAHA